MTRRDASTARRPAPGRKLLLIQPQAENAGAQEIARLLAGSLAARGYATRQLFFYRKTDAFDGQADVVVCAETRPTDLFALARLLWRLLGEIRRERPDVVLCFQHYGNVVGGLAARLVGAREVIANQNTTMELTPRKARLADRIAGTFGIYRRIVVNSHDSAQHFADYPEAYRKRVVHIDHGFADKTSGISKAEARARYGLPAEARLLGCVSRLHPLKNIGAAIALLGEDPHWHLALAGQGPERPRLEAMAGEKGWSDRLHFVGELAPTAVGDFLAALDAFVFPSASETFGLAAIEAAQVGVPVIANRLPVLEEVLAVEGEPCALFVDVDGPAAFAAAVRRVLDEPGLAAGLTTRSRRLASRFPLDSMIDAYDDLIRGLDGPLPASPQPVTA
jgi:glycosyltransferase involved in cell wall biosynthesis